MNLNFYAATMSPCICNEWEKDDSRGARPHTVPGDKVDRWLQW